MMTFGISTHGPYASWHASLRRRHSHRSFRRTVLYWVLGIWTIELAFWTLYLSCYAMVWIARLAAPHLLMALRWMSYGLWLVVKIPFRNRTGERDGARGPAE